MGAIQLLHNPRREKFPPRSENHSEFDMTLPYWILYRTRTGEAVVGPSSGHAQCLEGI